MHIIDIPLVISDKLRATGPQSHKGGARAGRAEAKCFGETRHVERPAAERVEDVSD